jgi:hypothetical protein
VVGAAFEGQVPAEDDGDLRPRARPREGGHHLELLGALQGGCEDRAGGGL